MADARVIAAGKGSRWVMSGSMSGFRALWSATAATNLADGLVAISLPLLATQLTQSPAAVTGVGAALAAPWLLFALPIGALADRLDRRRMLLGANGLRCVAIGLLASLAVAGGATLPALYLAAFALGLAEVVVDTTAQAILPAVVPRADLESANSRIVGAQTVMNSFVGPSLAGLLAGISVAVPLGAGAWLYLAAMPLLLALRGSFRPDVTGKMDVRREVGAGLRFLWEHRLLRTLGIFVLVMNTGWGAWLSSFVLFAVEPGPMGLSTGNYGLLLTAMGAGGVLGSLITMPLLRLIGRRWAILADILGTVTMIVMPALTANLWLIAASIVIGGAGATMWIVVVTSVRQQAVPDALLGRVGSAYRLFSYSGVTFGALGAGLIAEMIGLRAIFALNAIASLTLLVPFFLIVTDEALTTARDQAGCRDNQSMTSRALQSGGKTG